MLIICGEFDRICHEPDDKKHIVGCLERSVGLFGGLVNRECDDE